MPKKPNNLLSKTFKFLVYIAPTILFFSYWPNFHLGANNSMNFEFSLPIVWLVLFDIIGLILIIKNHKVKNVFKYWLWLLFPIFLTLSIIWSPNTVRGILTIGILWLVYFAGFSLFELKNYLESDSYKTTFYKIFLYSTLAICAWCWLQSILDLIGINYENTLMCQGCVTAMFGFPHPNGFAIEPQFMGNLLLAPTLLTAWMMIKKNGHFSIAFLFFLFSATLFLTFSRGAIYAFIVAMSCMTIYYIVHSKSARPLLLWPLVFVAFLVTLNFQGLFAELGPTSDTYFSGISKSLNQLSLGIIDIRAPKDDGEPVENNNPMETTESIEDTEPTENTESAFDGYVAESTDFRVKLNDGAIDVWKKSPTNLLFGVGLGGAGEALYQNGKTTHPKEIVQNQYFSLLLESGLVGITLLIFTIALIIKATIKTKISGLIFPMIIAYAISLCFFAGLPNALHTYLLPTILLVVGKN